MHNFKESSEQVTTVGKFGSGQFSERREQN